MIMRALRRRSMMARLDLPSAMLHDVYLALLAGGVYYFDKFPQEGRPRAATFR